MQAIAEQSKHPQAEKPTIVIAESNAQVTATLAAIIGMAASVSPIGYVLPRKGFRR
jgi:hypothetical protein